MGTLSVSAREAGKGGPFSWNLERNPNRSRSSRIRSSRTRLDTRLVCQALRADISIVYDSHWICWELKFTLDTYKLKAFCNRWKICDNILLLWNFFQYNFLYQNTKRAKMVDPMALKTSYLVTIATDYPQSFLVGGILFCYRIVSSSSSICLILHIILQPNRTTFFSDKIQLTYSQAKKMLTSIGSFHISTLTT